MKAKVFEPSLPYPGYGHPNEHKAYRVSINSSNLEAASERTIIPLSSARTWTCFTTRVTQGSLTSWFALNEPGSERQKGRNIWAEKECLNGHQNRMVQSESSKIVRSGRSRVRIPAKAVMGMANKAHHIVVYACG